MRHFLFRIAKEEYSHSEDDKENPMNDTEILHHITELVNEEHQLMQQSEGVGLDDEKRERMKQLEVSLDQCWDLLRQRRAKREFGADPESAEPRDIGTVENYTN
jgi:hypothetical protein